MKKHLAILFLLSLTLHSFGQTSKVQNHPGYDYKWIHFGFMVGLNTMDFGFTRPLQDSSVYFADVSRPRPGFQVSIVSDLRLGDRLSLRFLPGITFGSREFSFYANDDSQTLISQQTVESNFLDFPLLIKYKSWRVNNYRPYLVGGINVRYDMAARKDYEEGGPYVRLHPLDFYLEFGVGIDFFLQYFKFSPEIKVSAGLRDVLVHDPAGFPYDKYANSIKRLNSYLVMLCFYFE